MKELQELFDTLPEHLQHQILIGALEDGQEIERKSYYDANEWESKKNKHFQFRTCNYRIKWNLDKEEIKVGDVVFSDSDIEDKYIVFLKFETQFILYSIAQEAFTKWLDIDDLTLYKPKTEKEELIDRLEGLEDIDDIVLLGKETVKQILKYLK